MNMLTSDKGVIRECNDGGIEILTEHEEIDIYTSELEIIEAISYMTPRPGDDDYIRMADVRDELDHSAGQTSRKMDKLEVAGLVETWTVEADVSGRKNPRVAEITEFGEDVIEEVGLEKTDGKERVGTRLNKVEKQSQKSRKDYYQLLQRVDELQKKVDKIEQKLRDVGKDGEDDDSEELPPEFEDLNSGDFK